MDYLPYSQEYMLAVSIMGGMILGFIWDIYRLIRHYIKLGGMGTAIGDIVYWLINIYIGVQLIFDLSYGNIRFFILMGFVLGALLYFYGISKYVLRIFIFVVGTVLKLIKKIINLLIAPVKFIYRQIKIILQPVKLKYEVTKIKAKKRYKFIKFRLKKVSKNRRMIYNKKKQAKHFKKRRKEQKRIERRTKDNRTKEKNKQ
ncbi:MAG: spore cortex biosynthesis protein YabQ [Sedimentibacter sp.]